MPGKHFIISAVIITAVLNFTVRSDAKIVKVNHSSLFANISTVPLTAQDAFSICVKDKDGRVSVNQSMENFSAKLETCIKENAVPYGMENMTAGKDPENMPSKAELKKMTKDEKIAFAMKMQSQMTVNSQPDNIEVYSKCIELNNKFAEHFSKNNMQEKLLNLEKKYGPLRSKIDEDTSASFKSCPEISSGEMSAPDPKCIKTKKLAGVDKHIALSAKYLVELREIISSHSGRIKGLFAELDQLMDKAKYGDGVSDSQTRTLLNQVQGLALQQIMQLESLSQSAYTNTASYVSEKQKILEKE